MTIERAEDRSDAVTAVATRMFAARERHGETLVPLEGQETFGAFQDFIDLARRLASEGRLSRWVFVARKP